MVFHQCNDCEFSNTHKSTVSRHCIAKGHTFTTTKTRPQNVVINNTTINNGPVFNINIINITSVLPYNSNIHMENFLNKSLEKKREVLDGPMYVKNIVIEQLMNPDNPQAWSFHSPNANRNVMHLVEESGIREYTRQEGFEKIVSHFSDSVDQEFVKGVDEVFQHVHLFWEADDKDKPNMKNDIEALKIAEIYSDRKRNERSRLFKEQQIAFTN